MGAKTRSAGLCFFVSEDNSIEVKLSLAVKIITKTFLEKVYFFAFLRYNVILGVLFLKCPALR